MTDQQFLLSDDEDALSLQTGQTLTAFLHVYKPNIVVEAGTYRGSFAILAAGMCPTAEVYTSDVVEHPWRQYATNNNLLDRITFVQDDFEQIAVRYPQIVGRVDFALIDSGWPVIKQEPAMRLRHFRAAQRWMAPGGIIFVDDMAGDWPGRQEIANTACIMLPTDRGLAIWRNH